MFEQPLQKKARRESATKSSALDKKWYSRFEEIGAFQAYKYLDGDSATRSKEKEAFLSGEKENPDLDYPRLEEGTLLAKDGELLDLKKKVLSNEKNEVVKNVYRWRLNEKIAENRLLLAAATGDMRRFRRYSEFIYGKPSREIFEYTLRQVREELGGIAAQNGNPFIQEETARLLNDLPDISHGSVMSGPDESKLSAVKNQTERDLGSILDIPDSPEKLTGEEIRASFESALQSLSADGWIAVIDPKRTGISVNQERRAVQVPPDRKMPTAELKGLIAHEIGTHTARRLNGERTRLRLLGLGLDRHEGGEEGIATLREQALSGEVDDYSGFDGHFAISLASGLDGHPRDFRETYDILFRYYLIKNLARGTDAPEAQKKAANTAWGRAVRTFRGTDSKTPGACFTKDIIYREGNIAVWETLHRKEPEMQRWNIGKYDPSNPRHLWVLDELGITDADLSTLQKG
ncbi:MAG: tyrosine/phenylalanine carboxypeptidase domain-containing protein [Candidatus Moraniibacteriota bacterium]